MEKVSAQEQKRRVKRLMIYGGIALAAVLALCVFLLLNGRREKEPYVDDRLSVREGVYPQDTESVFTLMVYMVGSNLESEYGCASSDLEEMAGVQTGENVQIVIQTGGCSDWFANGIPSDSVQRFAVRDGEIVREADIGLVSMVEQNTLSDFIRWSAEHHPAERYGLIMWDHGGGTFMGYGRDENFPEKMMGISAIKQGIADGGEHFEFIGMDACLMATVEIAYMLEPYADYLIASEETEPGWGWHYKDWISVIGNDPYVNVPTFAKHIANDFVNGRDSMWGMNTMSVIDLSEIPALYERLCELTANTERLLDRGGYRKILAARTGTGFFGRGEYEQIDITEYVGRLDIEGCDEVIKALDKAVVYFDTTVDGANGLAMYFPYEYPGDYGRVLAELRAIGLDEGHLRFLSRFVSLSVYGQAYPEYEPPMTELTGAVPQKDTADFGSEPWFDGSVGELAQNIFDGAGEELTLDKSQRRDIRYIERQVFLDDGKGYIDLGGDNMYDFSGDTLKQEYDGRWVALNGQIAAFRTARELIYPDGEWYTYGYVPALLNGEEKIEIMLHWDNVMGGYVRGYRINTAESGDLQNSLRQFSRGDTIQLYANYYTYGGEFTECRYLGEPIEYDDLTVSYEDIGDIPAKYCWRLRDIFGRDFYTEIKQR